MTTSPIINEHQSTSLLDLYNIISNLAKEYVGLESQEYKSIDIAVPANTYNVVV